MIYQLSDLKPTDIRYDVNGVWVKDQFTPSDNPRLAFAKQLAQIPDDGRWYGRGLNSWVHSRVKWEDRGDYMDNGSLGAHCVIGGAGFGYERDIDGTLFPMPHLGYVVIEQDVKIHNNVCIDRGVIGSTIIGAGTCIDNLVHCAHGVKIGKRCLIVAGAVLGGSCEIGDDTFIGMNVSIKNKIIIGKNCVIGAGAVVLKDIPDNEVWVGNPAKFLKKNDDIKSSLG